MTEEFPHHAVWDARTMQRLSLTIARFALSGWVGAAALFVITGVREVKSENLTNHTKDVLVLIRFPCYYTFGFACVGVALVATLIAAFASSPKGRLVFAAILTAIALALMLGDYQFIYTPLAEEVVPPGQPRSQSFNRLHEMSKSVNIASVSLCWLAAIMLCIPLKSPPGTDT